MKSKAWRAVLGALVLLFILALPLFAAEEPASDDVTPQERRVANQGAEAIEERWSVIVDPVITARLQMIVGRIAPTMTRRMNWQIKVLDTDMKNAFSIPDGRTYVCRGMLDFVKSDLELAGIIAHELAHADRSHVILQAARDERMSLVAIIAAIASRGQVAPMLLANVVQIAVMGSYSVDIEKEADAIGIDALMKAGYNPIGMLTLQERMEEEDLKHPPYDPGIARTHPETKERVNAAIKYLRASGITVNRKLALRTLRPSIEAESGRLSLKVDDTLVWSGPENENVRALFEKASDAIERKLRMETAPYDVRSAGNDLYIEGERVLSVKTADIPGLEPLSLLRDRLIGAQTAARRSHPFANYDS